MHYYGFCGSLQVVTDEQERQSNGSWNYLEALQFPKAKWLSNDRQIFFEKAKQAITKTHSLFYSVEPSISKFKVLNLMTLTETLEVEKRLESEFIYVGKCDSATVGPDPHSSKPIDGVDAEDGWMEDGRIFSDENICFLVKSVQKNKNEHPSPT